jgi:hypothetical protein
MLDPPFDPGAKEMLASALPATAETEVGATGTVYGVEETIFEGVDVPLLFCAITSKSYDCPFVREVAVAFSCEGEVVA